MNNQVHTQIVSFIWSIADDCLRDVYVRGKYRDVILPMTVIRRLDAMLEGTIENVRNADGETSEIKLKKNLLECSNNTVRTDAESIIYNIPQLFLNEEM